MQERELKLHVPASARAAVLREMRSGKARRVSLQARYFDTPDSALARAGIALRVRKEGRRWVQTIKAPGTDTLSRTEINHVRPTADLDLALYTGTALESFFAALQSPLTLRYETRVTRLLLDIQAGASRIELAFDQGSVFSGEAELPICELEFELMEGQLTDVFAMAAQWVEKHGLLLDLRSKAERGDALADVALAMGISGQGMAMLTTVARPEVGALFKARKAEPVKLRAKMPVHQAYVLCASECLEQIIRNAALAGGVDTAQAGEQAHIDYVHQLRVGIRRLRSCWKLFKGMAPDPDPQSVIILRQGFAAFGDSRDDDVVRTTVAPMMQQAGLPPLRMPPKQRSSGDSAAEIAAGVRFQLALLRLLHDVLLVSDGTVADAIAVSDTQADTSAGQAEAFAAHPAPKANALALKQALQKRLAVWLRSTCKKGSRFQKLPIDMQHDVRKSIKNIRYCIDFSESVLPRSGTARLRLQLAAIQEELGELNDFYVAQSYYQKLLEKQPQAWFAMGWLSAMQAMKRARAQKLFRKLSSQAEIFG